MGIFDKAKKQLTKAVDQHGDTIDKGADQVARTINEQTGNKHAAKVAQGRDAAAQGARRARRQERRLRRSAAPPLTPGRARAWFRRRCGRVRRTT